MISPPKPTTWWALDGVGVTPIWGGGDYMFYMFRKGFGGLLVGISPHQSLNRLKIGYGINAHKIQTKVLEMTPFGPKIVHTTPKYPQGVAIGSISLMLRPSYGAQTQITGRDTIFEVSYPKFHYYWCCGWDTARGDVIPHIWPILPLHGPSNVHPISIQIPS